MSTPQAIQEKIANLPDEAQGELITFLEYLEYKFGPQIMTDEVYQALLQNELLTRYEALKTPNAERFTSKEVDDRIKTRFGW